MIKKSFLIALFFSTKLLACEGCKMVGTKGVSEPQTLQAGFAFSWSVLFMLAFVFCLIGFLFYILRSAAQQRQEALSVK